MGVNPGAKGKVLVEVLLTVVVTVEVSKTVTALVMVATLTTVVVVLKSDTAVPVVVTIVVIGTMEVTVDAEAVTDVTGTEEDKIKRISGSSVIVEVVVLMDVLAELPTNFVVHWSVDKVEELIVTVKSALTFSKRVKRRRSSRIIV